MDISKEHIIQELLASYFAGTIADDDRQRVDLWLQESSENLQEFEHYKRIWEETANINPRPIYVNTDDSWKALQNRINQHNKQTVKTFQLRFLKIAAIILIPLIIGSVFYVINKKPSTETITILAQKAQKDTLSDGSIVSLTKGSTIEYLSDFNSNTRNVKMTGEVYFDVAHNKDIPFNIYTQNTIIRVIGTQFNIISFAESSIIEVQVKSGKVLFMAIQENSNETAQVYLMAGEKALYDKQKKKLIKLDQANSNDLFKHTGILIFNKNNLQDICNTLEKSYNVTFNITNDSLKKLRFSSEFENTSLDTILQIIAVTLDLRVEKKQNSYYILTNE